MKHANGKVIVLANDIVYGYALKADWAVGGSERYQWLLARALAENGWDVKVGVRKRMESGRLERIEGVEFIGIGCGQVLLDWHRFLAAQRPNWWYWQAATHWWGPAVEAARLNRVRTIFSAAFDTDVTPRKALNHRRRWWPMYAWGLARSDRILVQHKDQLQRLRSAWRRKASVLPGTVEVPERYTPHAQREPYVAWVGVLREPKRPDLLVELARRLPDVRFVVCGGPSVHRTRPGYSQEIIDHLGEIPNVDYRGQVPPQRALDVIRNAAFLLSTSTGEGFPSVFLEAWAGGTPVVSTFLDPDELIQKHDMGFAGKGLEETLRMLPELVASVERREEMGRHARAYVSQNHSYRAVAAALARAIEDNPKQRQQKEETVLTVSSTPGLRSEEQTGRTGGDC